MAMIESWVDCDLKKPVQIKCLTGNFFSLDNDGNLIGVKVFDNGEPVTLSGTVSANVIRADGTTVAIASGTLSGNKASVILPQAAYAVRGNISIAIKLTHSGTVTTLACVVGIVYPTSTDTPVDPGTIIPSIQTLITQIETAVASVPADYSTLWTTLAPAYSTSATYAVGQYVTYDGGLYRCISPITTAEAWTSAHWTAANTGTDLSELKSALEELKDGCIDANVKHYFAVVDNPSQTAYANAHCRIGVTFEKGVCRSVDHIVVKHNGVAVPFEFEPCANENGIIGGGFGYYNDFSVHSGYLIVLSSVSAESKAVYDVYVYPTKQEHNFERVISLTEGDTNSTLAVYNGIEISFLKSRYTINGINGQSATSYVGKITNGNVNMRESDNSLGYTSLDITFDGNGVVYKKIKRTFSFTGYKFIQSYTLYADSCLDVESYYLFDNAASDVKTVYSYFSFNGAKGTESYSRDCYVNGYTVGNTSVSVSLTHNIVNSQRDDVTKPIYTNYLTRSAQSENYTARYGISASDSNGFRSGYEFYSKITFHYGDGSSVDLYCICNPLVSFAADYNGGNSKASILSLIEKYILSTLQYIGDVSSSETFRKRLDHYITYFLYKIGRGSLTNAYNTFANYLLNVLYTDINSVEESDLLTAYSIVGLPYMGRGITLAYYLMKDYENVDQTKYTNLRNVVIKFADMLCTHWEEYGQIGTKADTSSSTANTLSMALYGISLAIDVSNDARYKTDYDSIIVLLNTKVGAGNIFVESDSLVNRYLHYAAFSTAMYSLGYVYYKDGNKPLLSSYAYAMQSTKPVGQICDITECSSDSRRGMAHSYTYIITTLLLSNDVSAMNQAVKCLEWLMEQTPIVGQYPNMLDGYTTYSNGDININNLEFSMTTLIELRDVILNKIY